jgi:prevent-host-death family protein
MQTINIHEAKTHLSKLIEGAVKGEPFVIAKAGKPMVVVTAYSEPEKAPVKRIGFMEGAFTVPDDFDTMGASEIESMFIGMPTYKATP